MWRRVEGDAQLTLAMHLDEPSFHALGHCAEGVRTSGAGPLAGTQAAVNMLSDLFVLVLLNSCKWFFGSQEPVFLQSLLGPGLTFLAVSEKGLDCSGSQFLYSSSEKSSMSPSRPNYSRTPQ